MMYTPRTLRRGPFRLSDIAIEHANEPWPAHPDYDALIAPAWEKRVAQAAKHGQKLWDGTWYRVRDMPALEAEAITLRLGTISFRYIAAYRLLHEQHTALGLAPLNHLTTAALIRTSDGHYLFGRRGNGVIDLIGGGVQPDELPVATGTDLERNLYKEMREEVGIAPDVVTALTGAGIVMAGNSNIILIAHAPVRMTKSEAEAAFAHREEDEMAEPVFVPEAEVATFLDNMTDYRRLIPALL